MELNDKSIKIRYLENIQLFIKYFLNNLKNKTQEKDLKMLSDL